MVQLEYLFHNHQCPNVHSPQTHRIHSLWISPHRQNLQTGLHISPRFYPLMFQPDLKIISTRITRLFALLKFKTTTRNIIIYTAPSFAYTQSYDITHCWSLPFCSYSPHTFNSAASNGSI